MSLRSCASPFSASCSETVCTVERRPRPSDKKLQEPRGQPDQDKYRSERQHPRSTLPDDLGFQPERDTDSQPPLRLPPEESLRQSAFCSMLRNLEREHEAVLADLAQARLMCSVMCKKEGHDQLALSAELARDRPRDPGGGSHWRRSFQSNAVPEIGEDAVPISQQAEADTGNLEQYPMVDSVVATLETSATSAAGSNQVGGPEQAGVHSTGMSVQSVESDAQFGADQAFPKRKAWNKKAKYYTKMETSGGLPQVSNDEDELGDFGNSRCKYLRRMLFYPSSPFRLAWGIFAALLVSYDLIVIPLRVFSVEGIVFATMEWISLGFWSLNVLVSPLEGYFTRGGLVTDIRLTALQYAKTWLIVDLVVLVPDWLVILVGSSERSPIGIARVLRLSRFLRLVRVQKLRRMAANLINMLDSEWVSIVVHIVEMVVVLLLVNHYIACSWYGLADSHSGDDTWLRVYNFNFDDKHYQYWTAFHWSITQFTPASMHVQPQNITERLFANAVVVFALVAFSYLVGSITAGLAQLRSMQEDSFRQLWLLRKYLRRKQVSRYLSLRVEKYLEHALERQKAEVSANKVGLLHLLSEQLSDELRCEIALRHLVVHPLILELNNISGVTVLRIVSTAVSTKALAHGDALFFPGEIATHLTFLANSRLEYRRVDPAGRAIQEWVDNSEDWVAEPVLWTNSWMHLGVLTSAKDCEVIMLEAIKFCSAVCLSPSAHKLVTDYATNYIVWLNSVDVHDLSDIAQGEIWCARARSFMGFPS